MLPQDYPREPTPERPLRIGEFVEALRSGKAGRATELVDAATEARADRAEALAGLGFQSCGS